MRIIRGVNNPDTMVQMYAAVKNGMEIQTRGSKCRNVHNMAVILDGRRAPITDFQDRKLSLTYAKKEWLWYLGADAMDESITQYATMWKKLKQPDGSFFSNYGAYMFGLDGERRSQFGYVLKCLKDETNSRRASMVLLKREHLFPENVDTVCTYAINFTINGDQLDMTVMMRSNDVIFGFTNDAFCFWNLMVFMHTMLLETYPSLQMGNYTHMANSMHVYERHYDMIRDLVKNGQMTYRWHNVPMPSRDEVLELIRSGGKSGHQGAYTQWIQAE
jgi:thymidylate synthase